MTQAVSTWEHAFSSYAAQCAMSCGPWGLYSILEPRVSRDATWTTPPAVTLRETQGNDGIAMFCVQCRVLRAWSGVCQLLFLLSVRHACMLSRVLDTWSWAHQLLLFLAAAAEFARPGLFSFPPYDAHALLGRAPAARRGDCKQYGSQEAVAALKLPAGHDSSQGESESRCHTTGRTWGLPAVRDPC